MGVGQCQYNSKQKQQIGNLSKIMQKDNIEISQQPHDHAHNPNQQHQQDDCQDCQKQRAQNNQLIQFYQRLHKLQDKVTHIKPSIENHNTRISGHQQDIIAMGKKIEDKPDLQGQLQKNGTSMKNMGYELAVALLQREIKMKRENQKITNRIRELEREGQRLKKIEKKKSHEHENYLRESWLTRKTTNQENTRYKNNSPVKRFGDSLDHAMEQSKGFWSTGVQRKTSQTQNSMKKPPNPFFNIDNSNSSTFSSFEQTKKTDYKKQVTTPTSKYQNMNLWLYQYDIDDKFVGLPQLKGRKRG